jgi:hypothetical protein
MNLSELQNTPEAFRQWLRIEQADGKIAPLGDCVAPHQQECFRAADPALLKLVNPAAPDPPHTRFWWERCRGGSKTQDATILSLWLLFASRRPIHGAVVACDQEQAGIARETMQRLLRLNPELAKLIEIQRWQITNPHTTSSLKIMAADERSSYGLLLDFALADEVSLWPDDAMWVSITSTLGKRPSTLFISCGNAGWKTSWCWPIRELVRSDPAWHFHAMASPPAWISAAQIAEQRKLLPALAFQRLWCGEWVDSTGDALPAHLIEKAFDAALSPMKGTEPGYCFVAGVDLSVSRDYSAAVILASPLATNPDQRIRLADAKQWIPPPTVSP